MTNTVNNQAFSRSLEFVLRWEGGYVNNPNDSGGATNYGVTHAVYSAYRKSKGLPLRPVTLISSFEVREIYSQNYWKAAGCDLLPSNLAMCHFDWAVNHGTVGAIKTLQQVVGVNADGVCGPKTLSGIIAAVAGHREVWLCDRYNAIREGYYRRWGVGSQSVFLKGWLNRLNALRTEINHNT